MDKLKAKEIFTEAREQLVGRELVTDDGYDSHDERQNADFSASIRRIEKIRREIRAAIIEGIDCDQLWKDSFNGFPSGWFNPNAPEDLYTQTVTYIDLVLEAIEAAEGE